MSNRGSRSGAITSVPLAFGDSAICLDLSDAWEPSVFLPPSVRPLADPDRAIRDALADPIGGPALIDLARGRRCACIAIPDATRALHAGPVMSALLEVIASAGIALDRVTVLIATGAHSPVSPEVARRLAGDHLPPGVRAISHDARDRAAHRYVGESAEGVALEIDSRFLEADLRIVVGTIEPHLLAGFSGGRKLVAPGLVSLDTLRHLHSPRILEDPRARAGCLEGNPFHEEALALARKAGVDFAVNLVVAGLAGGTHAAPIAVFSGDLDRSHLAAAAHLAETRRVHALRAFPGAVASGGGTPLDGTFYQCIKGAMAAAACVEPGGPILLAGALDSGIGGADFARLLRSEDNPATFLARIRRPGYFVPDQWMVQHLCDLLTAHPLIVYSRGVNIASATGLPIQSADSLAEGLEMVRRLNHSQRRLAVLPRGPETWIEVAPGEAA